MATGSRRERHSGALRYGHCAGIAPWGPEPKRHKMCARNFRGGSRGGAEEVCPAARRTLPPQDDQVSEPWAGPRGRTQTELPDTECQQTWQLPTLALHSHGSLWSHSQLHPKAQTQLPSPGESRACSSAHRRRALTSASRGSRWEDRSWEGPAFTWATLASTWGQGTGSAR